MHGMVMRWARSLTTATTATTVMLSVAVCAVAVGGCHKPASGAGTCTPVSCADVQKSCGVIDDQCGGNLFCGNCDAPELCGLSSNICGCDADPTACDGKCGKLVDNCGQPMTCATCASGLNCGGGGANVCGSGVCTPATCADAGKNCGTIADGCGELVDCGTCSAPQSCGGGGTANVCGCKPISCGLLGKDCGSISDGCGAMLDCGSCAADKTCGGGGVANVCGSDTAMGTAVVSWTAPTTRVDGTPLPPSEIGGYRIYYGIAHGVYGPPIDVGNVMSHTVAGLSSGATYYFVGTTYDTAGNESEYSGEASKTFP